VNSPSNSGHITVLLDRSRLRRGADAFELGPPGPAALFEEAQQSPGGRHCVDEHFVEQCCQVVVESEIGDLFLAPVLGVFLEHRHEPVGKCRQAWIIGVPVGRLDEVEVARDDGRVLDLTALERHQRWHLGGVLRGYEDPGVAIHLDRPLRDVELAEPVEIGHRVGW
jgi:hypothetical protein